LHCYHACSKNGYVGRTNGIVGTTKILDDFVPLLDCQPSFLIAETSSSGFYFQSLVASHGKKALVVNPSAFSELFMTGKKTDRIDTRELPDRLKYHIEMGEEEAGFELHNIFKHSLKIQICTILKPFLPSGA